MPEMPAPLPVFEYICYEKKCHQRRLWSYSDKGLQVLIRMHELEHQSIRTRNQEKFDLALKSQPKKNYDTLRITVIDIGFLKTRGILVDDDMELDSDGYGSEHTYFSFERSSIPSGNLGKESPNISDFGDRA